MHACPEKDTEYTHTLTHTYAQFTNNSRKFMDTEPQEVLRPQVENFG